MARVERLRPRCVVRRIHDFLDFRGDPFKHDFETLPQGHLRRRAALAAAAHLDEKRLSEEPPNAAHSRVAGRYHQVLLQSSQVKSPNSSALFLSHVFVGFWSGLARL